MSDLVIKVLETPAQLNRPKTKILSLTGAAKAAGVVGK